MRYSDDAVLWRLDQARIDPPEPVEDDYDEPDPDELRDRLYFEEREA